MRGLRVPLLMAACALASMAGAQPQSAGTPPGSQSAGTPPAARPKVCLVLSGGGARGAAHIGVLKALESMHVPIDCITGTSMGSIVGGSYAGGMSTAEMERQIADITTDLLFKEKPPRQDQEIRRKLEDRSILYGVEFGVRDGTLLLPKGVVSGVQLETVLRGLSKISGYRKFDELPIPFRAVATDLVTGKAVVFSEGELANVMRASMSVPGAIAPAEINGQLLVDGGLTDNLPVDVARRMGADVVIAVNLGTPLMKREELTGILGVTGQMINILTEQNVQASLASLKPTDILIEPALGEFSAGDFDHLPKTIPIGEAATLAVQPKLAALALPSAQYAALRARQSKPAVPDLRPVDEIRFSPMARVNADVLVPTLETKPGVPLDPQVLDRDMRRLYGSGDFEHVNYRVIEEGGRRVLNVDAVEKSWGPNYFKFGLGLGSDFKGDAFFNAALSHRRTWINEFGAEWRTDLQFGSTTYVRSEFYQPLGTRRLFFVAPSAEFERRTLDLFRGDDRLARYDLSLGRASIDVGTDLGKYGEARIGYAAGVARASLDTGPPDFEPASGRVRIGAFTARLIVDQLDSANFPRAGSAGSINVIAARETVGAQDDFTRWDADGVFSWSVGRHSFQPGFKVGGKIGGDLPTYALFQWGGFLQQSGYPTGALVGERLTFGRLIYTYKLVDTRLLEGFYLGGSLEAGRMEHPLVPGSPTGLLKSVSVFGAVDTPIGPLYLGLGFAADGNRSAYLYLGRP
ncbi:MAG TPA: patatin-like phospholipase family protein [Casimicrobiaceae bacterium]|nr:patatin-like phospholipase family protein [Casimicrobiaceae bacterium]